jgi:hypothetical protein
MSVGYQNGGNKGPVKSQQGEQADWDALKGDVGEIADAAVARGRHFLDTARDQATSYVDRRKDDVAQSVTDFAGSLRESTRSFEDRPNIQAFVDGAAEGLDQLAETIRGRSFAEIFNEVEDVVRRRPAVVGAVTLTAGFMLARFIKASAEGMRQSQGMQQRAGGQMAGGRQGQRGGQASGGQMPGGAKGPQAQASGSRGGAQGSQGQASGGQASQGQAPRGTTSRT